MEPDYEWIRPERDEVLGERLFEVREGDERVYFVNLTDFEWITVTYVPPYNDEETVLAETGITNWLGDTGSSEDQGVWIFCADSAVVTAVRPGLASVGALPGTYTRAVQVQPSEFDGPLLLGGGDGEAEPDCV